MEASAVTSPGQEGEPVSGGDRRDLKLLALLLFVAIAMRVWVLCHTEVAARDSIGFIRYALLFEKAAEQHRTWADVVRTSHQHPGYPLAVLAVSVPVRAIIPGRLVDLMRLSAQLASSLAAVLLVLPMYFLGRLLFNRGTGFWSALLFQCLPVTGHVLADGVSEALFLLLSASALLFAAQALQHRSRWRFAVCGLFCGLAYLTRPEGALLLLAVGLSLLWLQTVPAWRRRWSDCCVCGTYLTAAALATGSPYFLTVGCFSNKPSVHQLMGQEKENARGRPAQEAAPLAFRLPAKHPGPVLAAVPAVMISTEGALLNRLGRGLWALGTEVINGFHYVGWIPALFGMWWYRRRPSTTTPGMWPLLVLCGLHALVLWQLAVVVGYLSDRHIQVLVLCGIYPAAAALLDLPERLRGWAQAWGWQVRPAAVAWLLGRGGPVLSLMLLLALASTGLPKTLHTLHAKRAGHHAAGLWLGTHSHPADAIFDRHAWAHYYAGRVFTENTYISNEGRLRIGYYHVINKGKDFTELDVPSHERFFSEKQLKKRGARVVYHWPPNRPVEQATVLVYYLVRADDAEATELDPRDGE